MRLTLRTLLAYLDDVLAPDATKSIGTKIQESPMAQLLVSRIKEVMRRRRLKAPDVSGPEIGIDPNIISQYLDNSLPAEQYAEIERVLLGSDELLAETASCHQVLALVLGESKEVSASTRERFYALGPVDSSARLAVAMDTDLELKSRTPHTVSTRSGSLKTRDIAPKTKSQELESTANVPEYLKSPSWWNRAVPLIFAVAGLLTFSVLFFPSIKNALQQANSELQRKSTPKGTLANAAVGPRERIDGVEKTNEKGSIEPEMNEVASTETSSTIGLGTEKNGASEAVENWPEEEADPVTQKPNQTPVVAESKTNSSKLGTNSAISNLSVPSPAKATVNPGSDKSEIQPPVAREVLADLQIPYTSPDGVLARFAPSTRQWFVVPHQSLLEPGDRIANLEPFEAWLDFEKAGVRATLIGETVLELLPPDQFVLQGINIGRIGRGRVILDSKSSLQDKFGTIGVAIGEDVWNLQLMSSDTSCALEVKVELPTQFEKRNEVRWYQAAIYVISGSAQWSNREGKTWELGEQTKLDVVPERLAAPVSNPIRVASMPAWCDSAKRRADPLRAYQSAFEKTFDATRPVDESMLTVITGAKQPKSALEKHPKIAGLAVHCLSATDNYVAMVQSFATCDFEEARVAARDGLRLWLPTSPSNGGKLKQALQTHYGDADVEAVYQMLWGFSKEDIKSSNPRAIENSLQFTAWMSNSKIEIRELADFWVEYLTGTITPFKASASTPNREQDIRHLEDKIRRFNGLIKAQ